MLEEKRGCNNTTMPPSLMRLATVLAEIAQNESNSANTTKPVWASEANIERKTENTADG